MNLKKSVKPDGLAPHFKAISWQFGGYIMYV